METIMFKRLIKSIEKYQTRRVAFWQLSNMSDRELRDIGLNRADIYRVAHEE
jgi:uncharacterized protein YjiS (DUF1127 family)